MYNVFNTSNVTATIFNERLTFDSNTTVTTINEPSREIKYYNYYRSYNYHLIGVVAQGKKMFVVGRKGVV